MLLNLRRRPEREAPADFRSRARKCAHASGHLRVLQTGGYVTAHLAVLTRSYEPAGTRSAFWDSLLHVFGVPLTATSISLVKANAVFHLPLNSIAAELAAFRCVGITAIPVRAYLPIGMAASPSRPAAS
jgi:hypothetical protein